MTQESHREDPRPPMEHDLKCHPKPFAALLAGTKTFEWREFDRDFQVGDVLILNEWDPEPEAYTGICVHREITYLLAEGFGIPAGYCIMGIKQYPEAPQAPLSEAKGPDLPPSSQPAPGDAGEAGGAAHG